MELALRRSFGIPFMVPLNRGVSGLGDCGDGSDPAYDVWCASGVDPSLATTGGSTYSQLIAQGVAPADAYQYDPTGAVAAGVDPSVLFPSGGTTGPISSAPAGPATPAEQAAASAWLLQNVPPTPAGLTTAQALSTMALTASQVASGLVAGTVKNVPVTTCPSGHQYSTGPCVPVPSTGLIAGVPNTTLAIVGVAFLALIMLGKKR